MQWTSSNFQLEMNKKTLSDLTALGEVYTIGFKRSRIPVSDVRYAPLPMPPAG